MFLFFVLFYIFRFLDLHKIVRFFQFEIFSTVFKSCCRFFGCERGFSIFDMFSFLSQFVFHFLDFYDWDFFCFCFCFFGSVSFSL